MQNQIPAGWQKVKLEEFAEDVRDLYEPSKTENLNYIGLEHIEQGTLRLNEIGKSSEIKSSKKIFKENDILFGTLRSYFRKIVKPRFSGVCSTDIAVIRAKENNDQNFLFYFIANPYFVNFASLPGEGTKMPRAKWSYLSETEWFIPKIDEQRRISSILSSFDDKIELNNKIAKTLEDMASVIFKEWFIKKVKSEKLTVKNLRIKDFGKVITGKTPLTKIKDNFGSKYPFVTIPDMTNTFILETERGISDKGIEKMKSLIIPQNSICVSCIATIGLVSITTNTSVTNQQINTIIPKKPEYLYFLYLFMKNSKKLLEAIGSGGSTALIINKTQFENIEITNFEEAKVIKFNGVVKFLYGKLYEVMKESQKLAQMRDLLLPKLMKGEIRIQ